MKSKNLIFFQSHFCQYNQIFYKRTAKNDYVQDFHLFLTGFCNPNIKQKPPFSDTVREISIKLQQVQRECLCCLWGFLIVVCIIFNVVCLNFLFAFYFSKSYSKTSPYQSLCVGKNE